jgi:hypothetical protein
VTEQVREYRIYAPQPCDRLVASLRSFEKLFRPAIGTVYYPGCMLDVSPSAAFPASRVVYADLYAESVLSLRAHGFEAVLFNAEEFAPATAIDVVLIVNSAFDPRVATMSLRPGGYFLYHHFGNAGEADRLPHLERVVTLIGDGLLCLHVFKRVDFTPVSRPAVFRPIG